MRTEMAKRAYDELSALDTMTSSLIVGWIRRHLLPLKDPKSMGTPLGGTRRWQYRIGDYRLLARVSEKKIVILAITHGHSLPMERSWMTAPISDIGL